MSGLDRVLCSAEAAALIEPCFTQAGVKTLIRGIRESNALKFIGLYGYCEMPRGKLNQVVEAIAKNPSIQTLYLEPPKAGNLTTRAQLTNLATLKLTMHGCYLVRSYQGPTTSLLDLIGRSNNLEELEVTSLYLTVSRLEQVLKRNTSLKNLIIRGGHS